MGKARRPASGAMDDVGRRLRRGRVSDPVARLECGAAVRGDSRAGARGPRQRGPQANRRARLYLPRLRHQLRRPSAGDLAGLQSARRHGKPHRRVEARSGRRWFLHETVFRHRGRLSRRVTAVQLAGRVPARGWFADLSPAGYPPDSGPHLRGNSWADRPPTGDSSVGKLGRTEDENSLARQHLELANPNFAEVGSVAHNLIPNRSPNHFPNPRTGGSIKFNFGIRAYAPINIVAGSTATLTAPTTGTY